MSSELPPQLPIGEPVPVAQYQPAGMGVRSLAFFMDSLLVFAFSAFLLMKILLPQYHSEGLYEWRTFMEEYNQALILAAENGGSAPSFMGIYDNEPIVDMMAYVQTICMLVCWCYFGLLESYLRGTTLGKRTFNLRTVKLDTGLPGGFFDNAMRGASKSIMLVLGAPFLWINFFIPFFNKQRRSGHDYLNRSIVIAE